MAGIFKKLDVYQKAFAKFLKRRLSSIRAFYRSALSIAKSKFSVIWKWIKRNIDIGHVADISTVIVLALTAISLVYLAHQTKLLENQVYVANSLSISQIGDRCMWHTPHGGDYDSYLLLQEMRADPINKEMIKAIDSQIRRVEDRYRSTDIMIAYASRLPAIIFNKKDGSGELADIDTVDVNIIFGHMEKRYLPTENIKAAYFMSRVTTERLKASGKTWEDVFNVLVWAFSNDAWCLYGRKMALMTYCQLAGTEFPGVFDFEKAAQDWKDRKQEILKKKNNL